MCVVEGFYSCVKKLEGRPNKKIVFAGHLFVCYYQYLASLPESEDESKWRSYFWLVPFTCYWQALSTLHCDRLSFKPSTSSQIMTQRLLTSYECSASSYVMPTIYDNLTVSLRLYFAPGLLIFLSLCISNFHCISCLAD